MARSFAVICEGIYYRTIILQECTLGTEFMITVNHSVNIILRDLCIEQYFT